MVSCLAASSWNHNFFLTLGFWQVYCLRQICLDNIDAVVDFVRRVHLMRHTHISSHMDLMRSPCKSNFQNFSSRTMLTLVNTNP